MLISFLQRYDEAAHHILDALVLQGNDGAQNSESLQDKEIRGVQSSALWASLKTTCLHMQRVDLATLCDREDLEGAFHALKCSPVLPISFPFQHLGINSKHLFSSSPNNDPIYIACSFPGL